MAVLTLVDSLQATGRDVSFWVANLGRAPNGFPPKVFSPFCHAKSVDIGHGSFAATWSDEARKIRGFIMRQKADPTCWIVVRVRYHRWVFGSCGEGHFVDMVFTHNRSFHRGYNERGVEVRHSEVEENKFVRLAENVTQGARLLI
jgi:hypothetical protein